MVWSLGEHLVLATIAFPLLVRVLLKDAREYTLTDGDLTQIDAFEALADTPRFTCPPADARGSLDSHWRRVRGEAQRSMAIKRAVAEWEQENKNRSGDEPDNETDQ